MLPEVKEVIHVFWKKNYKEEYWVITHDNTPVAYLFLIYLKNLSKIPEILILSGSLLNCMTQLM